MRHVRDVAALHLQQHRGRGGGEIAGLALELGYDQPVPGAGIGMRICVRISSGSQQRLVQADEEAVGLDDALAARALQHERRVERQHQRRMVVARVAVRRCRRRSCPCSAPAGRRSSRAPSTSSGTLLGQQRRVQQLVLGGHRADVDLVARPARCRAGPGSWPRSIRCAGLRRSAASSSATGCGRRPAAWRRGRARRAAGSRRRPSAARGTRMPAGIMTCCLLADSRRALGQARSQPRR